MKERKPNFKQENINLQKKLPYKKVFYSKKNLLYYHIFIIYYMISTILSKPIKQMKSFDSIINLKISQKGYQTFLGENFQICPDEVYVNEAKKTGDICKGINLSSKNMNVKLVWFNELNKTDYMFHELTNITMIDLSLFNTSFVTSMNYMFFSCTSLSSLNLSNIDTSLVTSMEYMFQNCISLTTINLIDFNTSNVVSMKGMFSTCIKVNNLDFS